MEQGEMMRTAKLIKPGVIKITEEKFIPSPGQGEVTIQIKAAGICGTDLHMFNGDRADVVFPRVMGHELAGVIVQSGIGVTDLKVGDRVVCDPVISCKSCRTCLSEHENVCKNVKCLGVQIDGGFRDYITINADQVYKYTCDIPFEQAALAEPFSVAANILDQTKISEEDTVVILGAGTIGLCVLQAVKALGAHVIIADIEDKKLKAASDLGAEHVINSKKEDLQAAVQLYTYGGADVVIDAVGAATLTELSIDLAAPRGRIAIISFDETPAVIPAVKITKKELMLVGSRMNCRKFPKVLEWFNAGTLELDKMITKIYPFEEIQRAFEETLADRTGTIKTVICL